MIKITTRRYIFFIIYFLNVGISLAGNLDVGWNLIDNARSLNVNYTNTKFIRDSNKKSWGIKISEYNLFGADKFRLHISIPQPTQHDWLITIKDKDKKIVAVIRRDEVEKKYNGQPISIWSEYLPGEYAFVEFTSDTDIKSVAFSIDKILIPIKPTIDRSIYGKLDHQNISDFEYSDLVYQLARNVAKIEYIDSKTNKGKFCSGYLVSRGLLMTNEHCISNASECQSAKLIFEYDIDSKSTLIRKCSSINKITKKNYNLDYVIINLDKNVPTAHLPLTVRTSTLSENEQLLVIGHPAGDTKKASIKNCVVSGAQRKGRGSALTDFGHKCDTFSGSSGSPVFDSKGSLVGLHHYGYKPRSPVKVNQAVKITNIINDLGNNCEIFNLLTLEINNYNNKCKL